MKHTITLSLMTIVLLGLTACGSNSSTNPNNNNPTLATNGDFVGLSARYGEQAFSNLPTHDWSMNINDLTQTFTASESNTGTIISGDINSTAAYIDFKVTNSNNTAYPIGLEFNGVGISDKISFIRFPKQNGISELATLIKQDICPTNDMSMVWHRISSGVLVNQWAINDIISDLNYNATTQSLLSSDSWTTQGGISAFNEASYLTVPAILNCQNGSFVGTQTRTVSGTTVITTHNGYITNDGYSISSNPGWNNMELGLPKKSMINVSALTGNYTGYLMVNPGNAYGFKAENSVLTAHIDFSSVGAKSQILALNPFSLNNLEIGYLNITRTGNINYPIEGEIQGEFNIFDVQNANHPLRTETLPLPNTLISASNQVDQTLADFRGHITCSAYSDLASSNKDLIVCEAYAHPTAPLSSTQVLTSDNLFTLVLVTGKYIPHPDDIDLSSLGGGS